MIAFLKDQPEEYHGQIMDLLERDAIQMATLLHLDFATEPLFLSNRNVPFTDLKWGNIWGAGSNLLVGLPNLTQGDDQLAPFNEYVLGIPGELIDVSNWAAEMLSLVADYTDYRNRDAGHYGQLFDPSTNKPVGHPFAFSVGVMDKLSASFLRGGAILRLTVESFMARKGVPVYGMQTYFDQKRRHPTDEGLQFTTEAGKLIVHTDW